MARRVSRGGALGDMPNIFANLALLGNMANEQEGEIAPQDLAGTSQEPENYTDIVGVPQYGDVRQNQLPEDNYLENLRKIAQLPLAMSEDSELRQDALENMRSPATLPDAIQEEQLEGLSGEMGAEQADQRQVPFDVSAIPRNQAGKMLDPLEFLRMRVEEDPSLLAQLPQETRDKLAATTPDRERAFVPPQEEAPPEEDTWYNRFGKALSMQAQMAAPRFPHQAPSAQPEQVPPVPEAPAPEPELEKQPIPTIPREQPISEQMIEQHPEQKPQMGALEQASTDDLIAQDLLALSGEPIPPEQLKRAKDWENIYNKQMDELNAEEKQLLQKAESGGLTTFDKVALGIAIAVPILLALRYGATPALLSAGEGLKGFAGSYNQQRKEQSDQARQKKERLGEIGKERVALQEKNVDINRKILDSIEDKAARQFLKRKQFRQFGDSLGISTGDEAGSLWLDANKFDTSDEGINRARKVTEEADDTIGIMKDSNKVVNDVLEILDQLPAGTGAWDAVKKNAQWFTSAGGANPFGGKSPKIKMKGEDGKMHEVDAFAVLKQKINVLQDLYNKQVLGGTRLTGNVVSHWGGILKDPSDVSSWLSQDLDSVKDTTRSLKDIMNSREVESLVGKGFLRAPLERSFPSYERQIVESEDNRFNRMRQMSPEELKKKVK